MWLVIGQRMTKCVFCVLCLFVFFFLHFNFSQRACVLCLFVFFSQIYQGCSLDSLSLMLKSTKHKNTYHMLCFCVFLFKVLLTFPAMCFLCFCVFFLQISFLVLLYLSFLSCACSPRSKILPFFSCFFSFYFLLTFCQHFFFG